MRRKTAKVRKTGLPDELHSNEGWAEAFWDWELHCLLSSKDVRSCFMVCYELLLILPSISLLSEPLKHYSPPHGLQDAKHLAFQRSQRYWYPCFTLNTLTQPLCASSLSFQGYVPFNQSSRVELETSCKQPRETVFMTHMFWFNVEIFSWACCHAKDLLAITKMVVLFVLEDITGWNKRCRTRW